MSRSLGKALHVPRSRSLLVHRLQKLRHGNRSSAVAFDLTNTINCSAQSWKSHRRCFQKSSKLKDNTRDTQAHSLHGFYADILAVPLTEDRKATTDLPTFVDTKWDTTIEERAAKLFGNIQGSGYERRTSDTPDATWRTINGVPVPPRPPEPDNCCMSGCVHCVWDDFRDDVESWALRIREAQAKGGGVSEKRTPKVDMKRPEVQDASVSIDDDGGGSESLWNTPGSSNNADDDLFAGIPVGIREFMAAEKRIRERKQAKKQSLQTT